MEMNTDRFYIEMADNTLTVMIASAVVKQVVAVTASILLTINYVWLIYNIILADIRKIGLYN